MGDADTTIEPSTKTGPRRRQQDPATAKKERPKTEKWLLQRERILSAAGDLFWRRGYAETSVKEIGKAAELNSATIFYYFKSKSLLLFEISSRAAQGLLDLLNPIATSDLPSWRKLEEAVEAHVRWAITNVGLTAIGQMERRNLPPRLRARYIKQRDAVDTIFRKLISDVIGQGHSRCNDSRVVSLFTLGLANSIVQWYRPDGERSIDEIVTMARIYVAGALNLSYFEESLRMGHGDAAKLEAPTGKVGVGRNH